MDFEQAIEILRAFEREGVRYVLFGSMAMAAHGIIRATEDIDFFVEPEASNVARIKRALASVFDDPAIDEISEDDLQGAYPVVRYGPADTDFTIDLVSRLGDAFTFDDIASEIMRFGDLSVRVATPAMLYRMKRDTIRPRDRQDADELRKEFGLEDEA